MSQKRKLTTVALQPNQHLISLYSSIGEHYCEGFTDGKKDPSLDGYYFREDLLSYIDDDYLQSLREQLANTDGFIYVFVQNIQNFLDRFHSVNPFMKLEAKKEHGPNAYSLFVISGD